MKSRAIVHPAAGGYWTKVPALPGCMTEGDTMEKVIANLKDTLEDWLDVANRCQKAAGTKHLTPFERESDDVSTVKVKKTIRGTER